MGKKNKLGTAPKALEARERKKEQKINERNQKQKAEEDRKWRENDRKVVLKQQKAEEEKRKRDEALKKRQELRELTRKEEEEAARLSRSKGKVAAALKKTSKVTQAERELHKDREAALAAERRARSELEQKNVQPLPADDDEVPENPNLQMLQMQAEAAAAGQDLVIASGLDEALDAVSLQTSASGALDKHPEKRMKAAYAAYEAAQMPRLKQENPGLRRTQLKEMLWKQWQKDPANPLVQKAMAGQK